MRKQRKTKRGKKWKTRIENQEVKREREVDKEREEVKDEDRLRNLI